MLETVRYKLGVSSEGASKRMCVCQIEEDSGGNVVLGQFYHP